VRTLRSTPFALLALALACSTPQGGGAVAATGTPEDETAIRGIADKYAAAMTAKDTAALGAITADDWELDDPTGRHQVGRAAALAAAAQDFAMMPAGMAMTMKATTGFVRWIDATHAIAGGTWEMSPAMPGMPGKGSWLGVAVKQGTEWKMISALGAPDMTAMMAAPPAAKP